MSTYFKCFLSSMCYVDGTLSTEKHSCFGKVIDACLVKFIPLETLDNVSIVTDHGD